MAKYDLREGQITALSTWTRLTTVGPETRNAIVVPAGMHSIKEIVGSFGSSVTTDSTGHLMGVRISGLKYGNYETLIGGQSNGVTVGNGGTSWVSKASKLITNLAVVPGAELWIEGCMVGGADSGTINCQVQLTFDAAEGEKRYSFIRWLTATVVDTKYAAINDATTATAYGIKIPSDAVRISSMVTAVGGILDQTAAGGTAHVRLEGGLPDGDFSITAGGGATLNTTAADSGGQFISDQVRTNVVVSPGAMLNVYVESTGVTWTDPYVGIAIEMACSMNGARMTYRTREGPVAAGDAWVLLATLGDLATPGPLTVPTGFNRIVQVIAGIGDSAPTAAIRNMTFVMKLTGINDGEALMNIGAVTGIVVGAAGCGTTTNGAMLYDVDMGVTPGNILSPYVAGALGVDTSAPEVSITYGFIA